MKNRWIAAACLLLATAAVFLLSGNAVYRSPIPSLLLTDASTGTVYACLPLEMGETFSVSFVHSVNQSEIVDYYTPTGEGYLLLYSTLYHAYGAGIPEDWGDADVQVSADGILVTGLTQEYPSVTYIVGTVSDHFLSYRNRNISLRTLCGKNSEVIFSVSGVGQTS